MFDFRHVSALHWCSSGQWDVKHAQLTAAGALLMGASRRCCVGGLQLLIFPAR